MLKNRILILFIVILCVFGFGCGSVYATEEAVNTEKFSFTGFDGVLYTLPSLPEGVNNYKHYVILKDNSATHIYCFNDTLDITKDGSFITLNADDNTTGKLFTCYGSSWNEFDEQGTYSFSQTKTIFIYSCPDLTQYGEEFNSDENFFLNPQVILPPIAEKVHLGAVLQEIMAILPVVLVTIVGLIGLRKALAFLSKVLRRS